MSHQFYVFVWGYFQTCMKATPEEEISTQENQLTGISSSSIVGIFKPTPRSCIRLPPSYECLIIKKCIPKLDIEKKHAIECLIAMQKRSLQSIISLVVFYMLLSVRLCVTQLNIMYLIIYSRLTRNAKIYLLLFA